MRNKASTQIILAVLIMLAMVCGMLLLPGNDVVGAPGCVTDEVSESGPIEHALPPMSSASCTQSGTSGIDLR